MKLHARRNSRLGRGAETHGGAGGGKNDAADNDGRRRSSSENGLL